jgi:hypothetical protein
MDLSLDASARDFPSIPLPIGAVLDIRGTAPSLKALREHITACLPRLPALRHHLDGPRLKARWVHDPQPPVSVRVRGRILEPGGLEPALAELIALPLPQQGPPWDLRLLHGHTVGTYTLCYRVAHTAQDGVGVRNTLYALFGSAVPDAPQPARPGLLSCAHALRSQLRFLTRKNAWNTPATPLTGERMRG